MAPAKLLTIKAMKDLLPVCTLLLGQVSPPGSLPRPEDLVEGPGLSSVPVT